MKIVTIDGTNGAGKTQLVGRLSDELRRQMHTVATFAPYVRDRTSELYSLWEREPRRAARLVVGAALEYYGRHLAGDTDVLILDRWWPTAAVSTTDEAALHEFARLPVDLAVRLVGSVEQTRRKRDAERLQQPWLTDRAIEQFQDRYARLSLQPFASRNLVYRGEPDAASRAAQLAEMVSPPRNACVLVEAGDRVLAISRGTDMNDWGLPGGKIEARESPLEAARRELREETGLALLPSELTPLYTGGVGAHCTATYRAQVGVAPLAPMLRTTREGTVRWVPWSALTASTASYARYNAMVHRASRSPDE